MKWKLALAGMLLLALFGCSDTIVHEAATPAQQGAATTGQISWLFVLDAPTGALTPQPGGGPPKPPKMAAAQAGAYTLTLQNVSPHTTRFSDRPNRLVEQVSTESFVNSWRAGAYGLNTDFPNAALDIFNEPDHGDVAVFVLDAPRLSGGNLTFTAWPSSEMVEGFQDRADDAGNLPAVFGLSSLFIDSGAMAPVIDDLITNRHWITYAPSYDNAGDPYNANPSDARITADLTALYNEGFRGLVTYTVAGSFASIPRIAKSVGFTYVITGIWDPSNTTELDSAASDDVKNHTDAYVVGNEGLTNGRYTLQALQSGIQTIKTSTGKPATTSEPGGTYYQGQYSADLLKLGDWLFPNIDYFLWGNQPSTPDQMWANVEFVWDFLVQNNQTSGPVVAKEVMYPTGPGPVASQDNQNTWFITTAATNKTSNGNTVYFVFGEAFDQPWKDSIDQYEPHMGFHTVNSDCGSAATGPRCPKKVITGFTNLLSGGNGRY